MAVRRPGIEVVQVFQEAAAALNLPALPAIVVGPGFQIKDGVSVGTYTEGLGAPVEFSYTDQYAGSIIDTSAPPTLEAEANAHKPIGVALADALLIQKATAVVGVTTISSTTFNDPTTNAFSAFDPDATGAATYWVEITAGSGLTAGDIKRHFVVSKTDDNNLVVATEFGATASDCTYRILVELAAETIAYADFSARGVTADADGVSLDPGLTAGDDDLVVVEADVLLSWRALRPDLASSLNVFTDTDSIEAVFGIGAIVPANTGAYGVYLAIQNTTTEVSFTGLGSDFWTAESTSFATALEYLEDKDVYALALLTHNTTVHQAASTHATGSSASTVGRERACFISRKITSTAAVVPASGIGSVTSAGASNGLAGTGNKTFRDPTNGEFVTDSVGVGHYLEISSYTAVSGVQRSVDVNESDFLEDGSGDLRIRMGNGAFTASDNSKIIAVTGATTAGNDIEFLVDVAGVVDTTHVEVTPAIPADELMVAGTRTWVTALDRAPTVVGTDTIVYATKTWNIAAANFVAADVGRLIHVTGTTPAAGSNDGFFLIASVDATGDFCTTETVNATGQNETFAGGEVFRILDVDREVLRDLVGDSVNGTNRNWTIQGAVFTSADVGRILRVTGAQNGANDDDHVIESVTSASVCVTTTATTPVTEVFSGLLDSLSVLDIVSTAASTAENAYIVGTRHAIASITSDTQLVLTTDPSAGSGITMTGVVYTITRDLTKSEEATAIAGYSSAFANRRLVHTWPDILAVTYSSVATKVPGYYAGAAFAGLTAGLPSQSGFTNLSITGFIRRENSVDRYSDTQLDTIAGGGTLILTQPVPEAPLSVRHQLTTDTSTIYFQEFSVTKNVDLIARFFRDLYRSYLGIYNITDTLMDVLKTKGEGGLAFLLNARVARVGAPIRRGTLTNIEESSTQPDTVEISLEVDVPLPLNNIKVTILV
ncbi:MAG: hypothetical protein DRP42_00590 [Tenericutes bacterium]|nr:MAG: hypothetical protein DRP42_00590 [Mycoplasmatota bacterium]